MQDPKPFPRDDWSGVKPSQLSLDTELQYLCLKEVIKIQCSLRLLCYVSREISQGHFPEPDHKFLCPKASFPAPRQIKELSRLLYQGSLQAQQAQLFLVTSTEKCKLAFAK
jgi:hypothetical protein